MQRKPPKRSRVLVISGVAGAGKSTVARRLQTLLPWPLLAKDAFKERLFESLGARDADESRRLSAASYALMFELARQYATLRLDCILEGNFRWQALQGSFAELGSHVEYIQLWCTAPAAVLVERLQHRAANAVRHPAHPDVDNLALSIREATEPATALPLPGRLFTLDTSGAIDPTLSGLVAVLSAPNS